jgi:hypothetical protein
MERGDLDEAHDLLERALAVAETLPSQVRLTGVLFLLAAVANVGGDHAHAEEIALRGLRIAREQGRWIERLELLTELAHARFAADPVEGALLLGAATAAYADRGLRRSPRATRRAGLLAEACRRSDDGAVRRALRDGELLSPAAAVDRALGAFSGRSAAAATVGRVS